MFRSWRKGDGEPLRPTGGSREFVEGGSLLALDGVYRREKAGSRKEIGVVSSALACYEPEKLETSVMILLDGARAFIKSGHSSSAVRLFEVAKELCLRSARPERLSEERQRQDGELDSEKRKFASFFRNTGPKTCAHRVIIISDSLGLPLLNDVIDHDSVETTYAFHIREKLKSFGGAQVLPFCRRFTTGEHAVSTLENERSLIAGSAVLLHFGLNDAAERTFTDMQRLAISVASPKVLEGMTRFAREQRVHIIRAFPGRSYLSPERFRDRLVEACKICVKAGAGHVSLATIVHPGMSAVQATPSAPRNFTRFNTIVHDVAHRFAVSVLDVDRICWGAGLPRTLTRDGMHLSEHGHELVSEGFVEQLTRRSTPPRDREAVASR